MTEASFHPDEDNTSNIGVSFGDDPGKQQSERGAKSDDAPKRSQATILIELSAKLDYRHDADGTVYALLNRDGHREVWPVRSKTFKEWLSSTFYKAEGKGCNNNAISDALNTIEARAKHESKPVPIYMRVAHLADRVYVDLCDDRWRVVEVTEDGWRVLDKSPVYFVRRNGMAALPDPSEGNVDQLSGFLNIEPKEFPLVVAWLVAALSGAKPYPVLVLQGEQGTGKSTTSKVIRGLCDPSTVPLRSPPREVRDLLVSAANNHCVVLDNLSGLNPELSDCLCRLSTGGGIDCRQLYSDLDQVLIEVQRPIIVNGIDDIATRPDLAERSIILNLPVIPATDRRAEKNFWRDFEIARPGIFGALLDGVSAAIRGHYRIHISEKPRMADFALWSTAAGVAFGWDGELMVALTENQDEAVEAGIEASPVGSALILLLSANNNRWSGNSTALYRDLSEYAGNQAKSKAWPMTPKGATNAIKRLAPSLRRIGITVTNSKDGNGNRIYTITQAPKQAPYPPYPPETPETKGFGTADATAHSEGTAHKRRTTADADSDVPYQKPSNDAGSGTYGTYGASSGPCVNDEDEFTAARGQI